MEIGSPAWKELIRAGARSMAIQLGAAQLEQFALHALELARWNRKMNLTAIREPSAVAIRHFLDSIVPVALIPSGAALLDIGSGGGFPGIPLKVLRPDLEVTLIDGIRKKVSFQKHVIRTLGLKGIQALQTRAEALPGDSSFDVVMTRALTDLAQFAGLALPLLSPGGLMIALKGDPEQTRREADRRESATGGNETAGSGRLSTRLKSYRLPGVAGERTIVVMKRMNVEHRTSNVE